MSKLTGYKSAEELPRWNRFEQSWSVLNDMDHLNELLRKQTEENLFLGTRNFD